MGVLQNHNPSAVNVVQKLIIPIGKYYDAVKSEIVHVVRILPERLIEETVSDTWDRFDHR